MCLRKHLLGIELWTSQIFCESIQFRSHPERDGLGLTKEEWKRTFANCKQPGHENITA